MFSKPFGSFWKCELPVEANAYLQRQVLRWSRVPGDVSKSYDSRISFCTYFLFCCGNMSSSSSKRHARLDCGPQWKDFLNFAEYANPEGVSLQDSEAASFCSCLVLETALH